MRRKKQLVGLRVGGWWEPVRGAVLRFAGAEVQLPDNTEQVVLSSDVAEGDPRLPMPAKIVITYISRQSAGQRKLTAESHEGLVQALKDLVARKGEKWELVVVEAEKLSKDEQLKIMARTTVSDASPLAFIKLRKLFTDSARCTRQRPHAFSHDAAHPHLHRHRDVLPPGLRARLSVDHARFRYARFLSPVSFLIE
jgi:hypothetical protein